MRCNVTLRQIASSPPLKLALLEDISLNEKQKNREISAKYQTLVDSKNVSDTMLVPPPPEYYGRASTTLHIHCNMN